MGDIDSGNILKDMQVFYPVNLPEREQEIAVSGESEVTTFASTMPQCLTDKGVILGN
ncbi:hypothetical protein DPMN_123600 [Dreissena polymorpha]|uniref:Uncharacterized protein n=1 Tax=Dreissena polymorpha TaxID=45954 RepID=A0A9D4GRX2_DREPO|nr:hypothetical protein DPMN_123600 [Dreissena polymorpha]